MPRQAKRAPRPKKAQATGADRPRHRFSAVSVAPGDNIRVERRFIVDGELTCVEDKGVFHGVQAMGSTEHILLEDKGEVRLIPLPTVSEIVLEGVDQKRGAPSAPGGFDPGFV